jgi:hypothetical protein
MTEEQIERLAERDMDRLDRAFMRGELSQEAYDAAIERLNAWLEKSYRGDRS